MLKLISESKEVDDVNALEVAFSLPADVFVLEPVNVDVDVVDETFACEPFLSKGPSHEMHFAKLAGNLTPQRIHVVDDNMHIDRNRNDC
jgi:hypothetical protein